MDGFLQVNPSLNLPSSSTNSSFADEVASICPLITPSPPTNDLINPLPEEDPPSYAIGEELATILQQHVHSDEKCDSASSSSSALAEPVCSQLLTHRNSTYHHVKDENTVAEETAGKVQPLQLTFRNPPENYFFMTWNWPLIRKFSLGMFLSALVAMLGLVIMMIVNLPRTCNPYTEWYQGTVFYEIFPASFYSSNPHHQYGDFNGIASKTGYFKSLGVRALRLNSIFKTHNYPEDYRNVSTLMEIAPQLGNAEDLEKMIQKSLHPNNISLTLDLPVFPIVHHLNDSSTTGDLIEEALIYWSNKGVDGFYLKGMEYFIDDPNLVSSLRRWKHAIAPNRIFIVSQKFINSLGKSPNPAILNNIDMIDIHLEITKGLAEVTKQIKSIQNSTFFTKRGQPWIHWSLGDESTSSRLANILPFSNATLGATLLQLMLPGTTSIFYGNEIGLQKVVDSDGDRRDLQHLHHLTVMSWGEDNRKSRVLPWMYGDKTDLNPNQAKSVAKMIKLRQSSPSIFYNSIFKEGENKANSEILYSKENLLVIQRWYPRRKSFVVVSNLGNSSVNQDLSTLLYSGIIVIGPRSDSESESISFRDISLWPGESVIIQLA